jgi:hypothetical protein
VTVAVRVARPPILLEGEGNIDPRRGVRVPNAERYHLGIPFVREEALRRQADNAAAARLPYGFLAGAQGAAGIDLLERLSLRFATSTPVYTIRVHSASLSNRSHQSRFGGSSSFPPPAVSAAAPSSARPAG